MNGLPEHIDLSFLIGRELFQICIGKNQFIIYFDDRVDDGLKISVESECVYVTDFGDDIYINDYIKNASQLCLLIHTKILSYEIDVNGGLILMLNNYAKLHILNSKLHYESFSIIHCKCIYTA